MFDAIASLAVGRAVFPLRVLFDSICGYGWLFSVFKEVVMLGKSFEFSNSNANIKVGCFILEFKYKIRFLS